MDYIRQAAELCRRAPHRADGPIGGDEADAIATMMIDAGAVIRRQGDEIARLRKQVAELQEKMQVVWEQANVER